MLVAVLAVGAILLRGGPPATGVAGNGAVPSVTPRPSGTPAPSAASAAPAYETPLGMAIVGIDGTQRQDLGLPSDAWGPDLSADGNRVFLLTRSMDVVHCFGCGNPGAWPAVVPVGKTSGLYICCDTDGLARLPGHRTAVSWRTNTRARTATSTCTWSPSSMTVPGCPEATPGA